MLILILIFWTLNSVGLAQPTELLQLVEHLHDPLSVCTVKYFYIFSPFRDPPSTNKFSWAQKGLLRVPRSVFLELYNIVYMIFLKLSFEKM